MTDMKLIFSKVKKTPGSISMYYPQDIKPKPQVKLALSFMFVLQVKFRIT